MAGLLALNNSPDIPRMNLPPPPREALCEPSSSPTVYTVAMAQHILKAAKRQAKEDRKRQREQDDAEVDSVAELQKQLKAAKTERKRLKEEKQKAAEDLSSVNALAADDWPEFDGPTKRKKAKPTRLDYWQLGNKAARERGPGLVTAATMKTLPEVWRRLQTHGWAVLNNMCELFDETCKPSKEQ